MWITTTWSSDGPGSSRRMISIPPSALAAGSWFPVRSGKEEGFQVGGGRAVSVLRDVGVELEREPGSGVPEPVLDHPRVLAAADHEGSRHMAQAVEGEAVEAGRLDGWA